MLSVCFYLFCSLSAVVTASSSLHTDRNARSTGQCSSLVEGPFHFCSAAGYNKTFELPKGLTRGRLQRAAFAAKRLFQVMKTCSQNTLLITMTCSYLVPQCSKGNRVYPCKRVCNEFLKRCWKSIPEFFFDYVIAVCHVLPNANASSGKCHEPPNFTTNDSIPGPLDRNCSQLIIPAFKNLGVSNYTLISVDQQKRFYNNTYGKAIPEEYKEGSLETNFPPVIQRVLKKYPRCQENLKKLYFGEYIPPCFPDKVSAEGHGYYTICQSACDEIARDCPDFFREDFAVVEYCSFAGTENSSHGFCRRKDWPPPFFWTRFVLESNPTVTTVPSPKPKGPKVWIIAVAVVVSLVIVGLIVGGAIWWKWRHVPSPSGYKKQQDDMAPLEGEMDI